MNGFSIRRFTDADITQTADLHQRGFELPKKDGQRSAYQTYFRTTFLESEWVDNDCPSLAAVDNGGRVIGFLGVVRRPMSVNGMRIRAALSTQFVVDPEWRNRLVGIELLKRFLSGPQDLSFTDEAAERSALIWERLGGVRSPIHSMYWLAPLRPAGLWIWKIRRAGHAFLPALACPIAHAGDELIDRMTRRGRCPTQIELQQRQQDPELVLENLSELRNEWPLAPNYNLQDTQRLIEIARSRTAFGDFRSVSLHRQDGRLAGCYMYYASPGGLSEVIQVAARRGLESEVLSHLIETASEEKAAGLIGRMDPRIQHAVAKSICTVSPRQSFMLVHARNRSIERLITSGSALLSRLDGEWCLRF
jgi:GNAT superfamily N-acetyltransferase